MGNLNSVVTVDIQLQTGVSPSESFDYVCLVGPLPTSCPEWSATTAYAVGDTVYSGTHVYVCKTAGTSGSTAPSGVSGDIADGTVVWNYRREVPDDVGEYDSLVAVQDAGWVTSGENADPVGVAAAVAFAQSPRPDKIIIAAQKVVSGAVESLDDTLARAKAFGGWYVICAAGIDESNYDAIAAWAESGNDLFVYTYTGATDPLANKSYERSVGYYGKVTTSQEAASVPAANKYIGVAAAVRCLSYPSGSETWAYKTLAGGMVPSQLTDTEVAELQTNNINTFEKLAGRNVTMLGKTKAGEWVDIIRFRDWVETDMQNGVANVILRNGKIPFTDAGISLIGAAMEATLMRGQERGGIMQSYTDESGNLNVGYSMYLPPASSIPAEDKAARILRGPRFEAYLSGAIHSVKIVGSLTYLG